MALGKEILMNAQNGRFTSTSEKSTQFFLSLLSSKAANRERESSPKDKNHHRRKDSGICWRGVSLTKRQLQCLVCVSLNLTHQQASERISISRQTYWTHVNALRKRLGFESNRQMKQVLNSSEFVKDLGSIDPVSLV